MRTIGVMVTSTLAAALTEARADEPAEHRTYGYAFDYRTLRAHSSWDAMPVGLTIGHLVTPGEGRPVARLVVARAAA